MMRAEPSNEQMWPETRLTLLQRLRNPDDNEAWERFELLYSGLISASARRSGLNETEVEEVLQRVRLVLNQKFTWQAGLPKFRAWLCRVIANRIHEVVRERSRWVQLSPSNEDDSKTNPQEPKCAPTEPEIFRQVEEEHAKYLREESLKRLRNVVRPDHYQVYYDCVVRGKTPDETASEYGWKRNHVDVVVHRLRRQQREFLRQVEAEEEARLVGSAPSRGVE